MPTSTIEDYLKTIYLERLAEPERRVATGRIAELLSVAPGTATSMMKTLSASGLVRYEPYGGAELTEAGQQLAAHVLRRHRLVEVFLVEVMGMNWSEVHPEAETLEHVISDRLLERMDEMLGHPAMDPHGDPIPTAAGTLAVTDYPCLMTCESDRQVRVTRVLDQDAEFLQRIERQGILPGRRLVVLRRESNEDTVTVRLADGTEILLAIGDASLVLVEPGTIGDDGTGAGQ